MAARSLPAPASVTAKAPSFLPLARSGRSSRFCSSLPNHDGLGCDARVDGDADGETRVAVRQLLERKEVRDLVKSGAAELGRDQRAQEAERAQLAQGFKREAALAVPGGGVRPDVLFAELAHGVPY
jgi:hypothetical protein